MRFFGSLTFALLIVMGCRGAGDDFRREFTEACTTSGDLTEPVCSCLADKAETDLSDDEQQFLLAALRKDDARTDELRVKLGLEGAMRAGMFMTNVASCAAGQPTRNNP